MHSRSSCLTCLTLSMLEKLDCSSLSRIRKSQAGAHNPLGEGAHLKGEGTWEVVQACLVLHLT